MEGGKQVHAGIVSVHQILCLAQKLVIRLTAAHCGQGDAVCKNPFRIFPCFHMKEGVRAYDMVQLRIRIPAFELLDGIAGIGSASHVFASQKNAESGLNKLTMWVAIVFFVSTFIAGFNIFG